ncbi:MAG: alkaline phosphatase family protein, partial [Anaerolineales bacterium]|nr:alkaline phosphatase family protein [Anaerolineales bacterium]
MPKVLVVGWDGATFDVIRPLVAEGKLPNLAKMMHGSWGTLRSTVPPVTPGAWTSFFTGKNPGKHGIFDFQDLDPATYEFKTVRTDRHREKRLWQILGEQGFRSLIFDVPFTYPPHPLHGWMLTGYGTPRRPETVFTYPENLADLLPPDLRHTVHVALPLQKFDRSQQFIDEWTEIMAGRQKLLHHLITTQAWDLFMVVFSITDNMAHVFWTFYDPAHPNYHKPEGEKFRAAFRNAYITADALLGDLMDAAGPDVTTLVLSDHGFGSVRPRQYMQQRLLQGGYHQLTPGKKS